MSKIGNVEPPVYTPWGCNPINAVHLMGEYLMGVYLMSVYLIGVYLMSVHLICVYLTNIHLMGVYCGGVGTAVGPIWKKGQRRGRGRSITNKTKTNRDPSYL
jgi:hypothetical protein